MDSVFLAAEAGRILPPFIAMSPERRVGRVSVNLRRSRRPTHRGGTGGVALAEPLPSRGEGEGLHAALNAVERLIESMDWNRGTDTRPAKQRVGHTDPEVPRRLWQHVRDERQPHRSDAAFRMAWRFSFVMGTSSRVCVWDDPSGRTTSRAVSFGSCPIRNSTSTRSSSKRFRHLSL